MVARNPWSGPQWPDECLPWQQEAQTPHFVQQAADVGAGAPLQDAKVFECAGAREHQTPHFVQQAADVGAGAPLQDAKVFECAGAREHGPPARPQRHPGENLVPEPQVQDEEVKVRQVQPQLGRQLRQQQSEQYFDQQRWVIW